jgi:hypothetical protein
MRTFDFLAEPFTFSDVGGLLRHTTKVDAPRVTIDRGKPKPPRPSRSMPTKANIRRRIEVLQECGLTVGSILPDGTILVGTPDSSPLEPEDAASLI